MADSPIPKEIADEAARWFAERDSGLLDDESKLNVWLDADPAVLVDGGMLFV